MKELDIDKNEANQRVDKFIRKLLPKANLSFIYKMIRKKNIKVNDQKTDNTYILHEGDKVQLYLSDETILNFQETLNILDVSIQFSIVYEDENILLVNKPSGLIIHPDAKEEKDTLINQAIKYLYDTGSYDPSQEKTFVPATVNRLDRNTSGIVIIGKNFATVQALNEWLREKDKIQKFYLALVIGNITKERELKGYLEKDEKKNKVKLHHNEDGNGKLIHTIIRPIATSGDFSLVEVEIITGRSHQIRLHLASIGNPIVGDSKYGKKGVNQRIKTEFKLDHQFLHAYKLSFNELNGHLKYLSNKSFICPLPKELEKIKKAVMN